MTTSISTTTTPEFVAVSYVTKAGKTKTAFNEVAGAFAPATVRKQAAAAAALTQLQRGIYRPTLAAVAALLTKGDVKSLTSLGYGCGDNPDKKEVVAFLEAIAKLWKDAKGEKAAQAAVVKEFLGWVGEKDKASTVPAVS